MPTWIGYAFGTLTILFFVAVNGFFVAAEFALVSVRRTRVAELVQKGRFGSRALEWAVDHLDHALAGCQVGITFASLALGWVGEPALAHLVEPAFSRLPRFWDLALRHGLAVAIAFLIITYLHIVFGEQVPKILSIRRAEEAALLCAPPLVAFSRIVKPFLWAINVSTNTAIRMLRLPPLPPGRMVHSVDELRQLVDETQKAGAMPDDQASYLRNVFRLSDKRARDVMVPREKVVAIPVNISSEDVLEIARESAHTRMPVWEGDHDNIVGIVNTKDLFHLFSLNGLVILADAMYPPLFVHPDQRVGWLMQLFKREKRPMAVVRDARGSFLGIVTLEDILEEIVGEIEDEHDDPRWLEEEEAQKARDGTPPGSSGAAQV